MREDYWDYSGERIGMCLEQIARDEIVRERWPRLGALFLGLADGLRRAAHDMDGAISGDHCIPDDVAFEQRAVGEILEIAMKAAPDEWFPRGNKWAAIHAMRDRQQRGGPAWPMPTRDQPSKSTLEHMYYEGGLTRATDGCLVAPDGTCPHGYPSWLLHLGYFQLDRTEETQ